MPIQNQCGSSMAIRQICQYKYTNRIYINQILVRWSSTSWHEDEQRKLFVFFCADKGARTDCGGSADLSAVIDCASCDATTNIGRVSVAQASLPLTLTPYSIPAVFRPIKPPWSALALLMQFESGVLFGGVLWCGSRSRASQLLSYLQSLQTLP